MPLKTIQKQVIDCTLGLYLDDIAEDSTCDMAERKQALVALQQEDENYKLDMMSNFNDSFEAIESVLQHRSPQNRSETYPYIENLNPDQDCYFHQNMSINASELTPETVSAIEEEKRGDNSVTQIKLNDGTCILRSDMIRFYITDDVVDFIAKEPTGKLGLTRFGPVSKAEVVAYVKEMIQERINALTPSIQAEAALIGAPVDTLISAVFHPASTQEDYDKVTAALALFNGEDHTAKAIQKKLISAVTYLSDKYKTKDGIAAQIKENQDLYLKQMKSKKEIATKLATIKASIERLSSEHAAQLVEILAVYNINQQQVEQLLKLGETVCNADFTVTDYSDSNNPTSTDHKKKLPFLPTNKETRSKLVADISAVKKTNDKIATTTKEQGSLQYKLLKNTAGDEKTTLANRNTWLNLIKDNKFDAASTFIKGINKDISSTSIKTGSGIDINHCDNQGHDALYYFLVDFEKSKNSQSLVSFLDVNFLHKLTLSPETQKMLRRQPMDIQLLINAEVTARRSGINGYLEQQLQNGLEAVRLGNKTLGELNTEIKTKYPTFYNQFYKSTFDSKLVQLNTEYSNYLYGHGEEVSLTISFSEQYTNFSQPEEQYRQYQRMLANTGSWLKANTDNQPLQKARIKRSIARLNEYKLNHIDPQAQLSLANGSTEVMEPSVVLSSDSLNNQTISTGEKHHVSPDDDSITCVAVSPNKQKPPDDSNTTRDSTHLISQSLAVSSGRIRPEGAGISNEQSISNEVQQSNFQDGDVAAASSHDQSARSEYIEKSQLQDTHQSAVPLVRPDYEIIDLVKQSATAYLDWMRSREINIPLDSQGIAQWRIRFNHVFHGSQGYNRVNKLLAMLDNQEVSMTNKVEAIKTTLASSGNRKHSFSRYLYHALIPTSAIHEQSDIEFQLIRPNLERKLNEVTLLDNSRQNR